MKNKLFSGDNVKIIELNVRST